MPEPLFSRLNSPLGRPGKEPGVRLDLAKARYAVRAENFTTWTRFQIAESQVFSLFRPVHIPVIQNPLLKPIACRFSAFL